MELVLLQILANVEQVILVLNVNSMYVLELVLLIQQFVHLVDNVLLQKIVFVMLAMLETTVN